MNVRAGVVVAASALALARAMTGCGNDYQLDTPASGTTPSSNGGEGGAADGASDGGRTPDDSGSSSFEADDSGVDCTHCDSLRCEDDGGCDPLVFVTDGRASATFGGPGKIGREGADALCKTEATSHNLQGTYVAWLSDELMSALARVRPSSPQLSRPVFNSTSDQIAPSNFEILDTVLAAPIRTISGSTLSPLENAWTGTNPEGSVVVNQDCSGWQSSDAAKVGVIGHPSSQSNSWTDSATAACNSLNHVYCFEIVN